jgi:hypothetical protein
VTPAGRAPAGEPGRLCVDRPPVSDHLEDTVTTPDTTAADSTPDTTSAPVPSTEEELYAWLDSIPPVTRERLLSLLVDARIAVELADRRRGAVVEVCTGRTRAAAAVELGMSERAVARAITEHNRRHPR